MLARSRHSFGATQQPFRGLQEPITPVRRQWPILSNSEARFSVGRFRGTGISVRLTRIPAWSGRVAVIPKPMPSTNHVSQCVSESSHPSDAQWGGQRLLNLTLLVDKRCGVWEGSEEGLRGFVASCRGSEESEESEDERARSTQLTSSSNGGWTREE